MTKKDQQASSLKSKSSSNSAGGLGGGISAGIRAVNDSITAPLSKSVSPKNKAKKKKLVGSLKGNDDDDDFPFFLPPSSSMLQQRANPPNHSHPPTSPKMTDPVKLMAQRSVGPSLTVSVSPKEPARSAPSSRTPSASPPTLNLQTPVSAQLRRREISPSSPATDVASHHSLRPGGPRRSSSQDGNFFSKVKKGKEHVQAGGLMAASFLDKVSHVAWDKLKSPRLNHPRHGGGRSSSPQHGRGDRYDQYRDTSLDVEVFGMDLREAVVKTRIVRERKMEGDATFWIPAIAYRCLQYLNVYGPHEVGIYRIPGSTAVVDELRAEFKIKHDVDLFENPPDDLHTVSSLLKGWFRSLPDAILPIDVQKRIYEKCKDQTESLKPPQAFVDELSNLPPYNYYLLNHLFSHLSTVCMESDVNKMNLSNLGMVFCSTLRIDRFCFNWLVNNWADCWAGCLTEETEYQRSMPLRFPSNSSSSHQQHSAQTPSHQQHPSQTSSHQQQPRTPPYQQPQQIPAYQQPPQTTSHEQSPSAMRQPPVPSSDARTTNRTGQYAETRRSEDARGSAETDRSQDAWPTVLNRAKLTMPPLSATLARREDKDGRRVLSIIEMDSEQAAHRERMERERERELEREREREEALGIRPQYSHREKPHNQHNHHPHHKLVPSTDRTISVFTDGDRYSTMVEPNKSPRQSIGDCGRLGLPQSLPPIPPLSPMIKEGHNMV